MKPDQRFSPQQLGYMRKARSQAHLDSKAGSRPKSEPEWSAFLSKLSDDVCTGAFSFGPLRRVSPKGKTGLTLTTLEDVLVARRLNDIVRRAYGVRQPDRRRQIETLLAIAREPSDKLILKLDIKSCFESISRKSLLTRLDTDGFIEAHAIRLIRQFFIECDSMLSPHERRGLPRGLMLSTTLAEVYLSPLEENLRKTEGVFAVLRYVDDVLIFSTKGFEETLGNAESLINKCSLTINKNKNKLQHLRIQKSGKCTGDKSLEFLGYKFMDLNECPKDNHEVLLADRKIAKTKRRIALAFSAYKRDDDIALLELRIRSLADNLKITTSSEKTGLYSGLAFSHPSYLSRQKSAPSKGSLTELNSFFRHLLRKYNPPTKPGSRLVKICFSSGHEHRRRLNISPKVARQVRECWEHEN